MNFVLFLIVAAVTTPLSPGDHERTVDVDGRERKYLVHVPKHAKNEQTTHEQAPSDPLPVVLVFHGGGSNALAMADYCKMNAKADAERFLVVYPSGTGRTEEHLTWNGGNCCGYAKRHKVDDVRFVDLLLDDLENIASVDKRRVFATGMSNGGILCYRLADQLSTRIAAIAPVAGTMGAETCSPKRPVPVLHFHGTKDRFVPFGGGRGRRSVTQTNFFSVDHSIQNWVRANGCEEKPTLENLPDVAKDGMSSTRKTYRAKSSGAEVVLITVQEGGHTWPGSKPKFAFLGPSTSDISANDLMWEFFQKHPMPEAR